jgi:hypothetical protein
MSLQPERPWWLRWGRALLINAVILGAISLVSHILGWPLLGPYHMNVDTRALEAEHKVVEQQIAEANETKVVQERLQNEERAARQNLAQELAALREENLHLKEDLASLRNLKNPAATGGVVTPAEGLKLSGFKVQAGAVPNEYRWHLLVANASNQARLFQGKVILKMQYVSGERVEVQPISTKPNDSTQLLSFKYYQEVEGTFRGALAKPASMVYAEVWRNGDSNPIAVVSLPMP